ncbi:MAG TPA: hypothetical protein VE110_08880 [Gemmatimonadaceae bacterium]|nr:hypothetical protein [Gemmatimonadaceae bacterium]
MSDTGEMELRPFDDVYIHKSLRHGNAQPTAPADNIFVLKISYWFGM